MKELIYILFFFSGLIKSVFAFYEVDSFIDFTLITSAFVLINFFYDLMVNRFKVILSTNQIYSLLSLLLFYLWMVITVSYSQSPSYKYEKAMLFLLNIIAFSYPILVRNFNYKRFFKINILFTIILSLWYMWVYYNANYFDKTSVQYYTYKSFYLFSSLILGLNLVIIVTSKEKIFSRNSFRRFVVFILIVLMLLTRGRGPLLFSIFVIMLFYISKYIKEKGIIISLKNLYKDVRLVFLTGFFLLFMYITIGIEFLGDMFLITIKRLLLLTPSNVNIHTAQNVSVDTRMDQLKEAIFLIFDNIYSFFLGYGIGSYEYITKGVDARGYPHNVFVEVMIEMGFVGLLLLLILGTILILSKKGKVKFISIYVIIFIILNMMKSNSIIDIRIYFTIFALYILSNNKQLLTNEK